MFWIQVDALRPLLDLDLTVGDFDREHGQIDRTLAHAIERAIPAAAAVAGFDTVELDYSAAQWRRNWSPKHHAEYGPTDVEALRAALEPAELVSVDLFDTLVLRPTLDPDALLDVLGFQFDAAESISDAGKSRASDPKWSGRDLVRLRREYEQQLRQAGASDGEVTLDEIYVAARSQHPAVAEPLGRLKRLELDLERRIAIPRTWLIDELLNDRSQVTSSGRSRRRYVLMVDTTQRLTAVEALLAQIGAGDLFDDVYVSSACRARKDSGSMWDLVHTLEAPAPDRWLHIGDNEVSDVERAIEHDVTPFHIPAPASFAQPRGVESLSLAPEVLTGTQLVAGHGLAALGSPPQRPGRPEGLLGHSAIEEFGFGVLGPLTLSFVNWLTHTARDRSIDRLLFTAPDGGLALDVIRRLRPFLPADLPRIDNFFMSGRIALALVQHDGARLHDIRGAADFAGSVGNFLDVRLGYTLPGEHGARLSATPLSLPRDSTWLTDQLEPFRDLIAAHGQRELAALRAYLDVLAVAPGEHLGFVNLDVSGTTQQALSRALGRPITGLHASSAPAESDVDGAALSCFNPAADTANIRLIDAHRSTFQSLFSAAHPPVSRLITDSRGLRAIFDSGATTTPKVRLRVEIAQAAAFRFVHQHIERFGPELLDERVDPCTVIGALERSLQATKPEVEELLKGFAVDDPFNRRPARHLS